MSQSATEFLVSQHLERRFADPEPKSQITELCDYLKSLDQGTGTISPVATAKGVIPADIALQAWRQLKASGKKLRPENIPGLLALLLVESAILDVLVQRANESALERGLNDNGANLRKTSFLYASFCTRNAFEAGRRLAKQSIPRSNCYLGATEKFSELTLNLAAPFELETQERYCKGMLGVSKLFLAFGAQENERRNLLDSAIENLQRARSCGDQSFQNARYLGQALLERSDFEESDPNRSAGLLDRAVEVLSESLQASPTERDTQILLAHAYVQRNSVNRAEGSEGTISDLMKAIDLYDSALHATSSYRDTNILGRRGQVHLFVAWGTDQIKHLTQAIDDLNLAHEAGEYQWTPLLCRALLTRQARTENKDESRDARAAWEAAKLVPPSVRKRLGETRIDEIHSIAAYAYGRIAANRQALQDAIDSSTSEQLELRAKARGVLALVDDDVEGLKGAVGALSALSSDLSSPGLLPKLCYRLARLLQDDEPGEADRYLSIGSERLAQVGKGKDLLSLWLLARNSFLQYRITSDIAHLDDAEAYAQRARNLDFNISPENLLFVGDVTLQAGKNSEEGTLELLEDAYACISQGVRGASGLDPVVSSSKLGEAGLRFGSLARRVDILEEAYTHLGESIRLGNESAEVRSLMGDVCYHLTKFSGRDRRVDLLVEGLDWKSQARTVGSSSDRSVATKEHFSVCARMANTLRELGYAPEESRALAIEFLRYAREEAPDWPWPVLQLAEIFEEPDPAFSDPDPEAERCVRVGDRDGLWQLGAKLALHAEAFQRLGGKSGVRFAKDPLGLISSTFVFKRGVGSAGKRTDGDWSRERRKLEEEMARTVQLGRRQDELGIQISTPTMVGVLDAPSGEPNLVMRRLSGVTLGEALTKDLAKNIRHVGTARKVLAAYHALTPIYPRDRENEKRVDSLRTTIARGKSSGMVADWEFVEEQISQIEVLPLVARRDAHPENWFVTPTNDLVILDVEFPTCKFFLEELVQLTEDLPILGWSESEVRQRREWLEEYWIDYRAFGGVVSDIGLEALWEFYLALTVVLGIFGIGLASRNLESSSITSFQRGRWRVRREHYLGLIRGASAAVDKGF